MNIPTIIVGIALVVIVVLACYFTAKGGGGCKGCSGNCKACKYADDNKKAEIRPDDYAPENFADLEKDNQTENESQNDKNKRESNKNEKNL